MRRFIFIAAFALLFCAGCAAAKEKAADINACWNDTVCRNEALRRANDVSDKVGTVAELSPVPGTAPIARKAALGVALVVFLAILGSKLPSRKKEISPTPAAPGV